MYLNQTIYNQSGLYFIKWYIFLMLMWYYYAVASATGPYEAGGDSERRL